MGNIGTTPAAAPTATGTTTTTAAPVDSLDSGNPVEFSERTSHDVWHLARAVLDANWSRTYTVPSRSLYPHQWSWDAAFISVGLARVDPDRAWQDLRSLFQAQWPDGRVPHIVFDPDVADRDYFPGPDFWQVPLRRPGHPDGTGIVQPPAHALAVWEVYRRAPDERAQAELRWFYPRLVAAQDYLLGSRDVGGGGLAAIVHPWESGLDNSPAWDAALAAVPADLRVLAGRQRHDNRVAAAAHRPTDEDYARFVALALAYRDGGYRDDALAERHDFVVECPGFNALLGAAEHALADIAAVVGADPAVHLSRARRIARAIDARLWNPDTGMYHTRDVRTGRLSPARCVNGLLPLILPDLPGQRVAALVESTTSARFGISATMPVASYDRTAADFDPVRYWRGPVWININWLLWRGLREHGRTAQANTLRTAILELVRKSGYYEYFHPVSGDGVGSAAFSWTAALVLDLLAAEDDDPMPGGTSTT
ncbi:MGH1-like glycoside hydrolase domain-containing protein [Micromonospora sp. NBC_01813]|uniref:MGH1-like glycoside hydrolase domain-containing protein n=1 Tax=Micromonospora sp. NBC_01813 TaxID=2975988 RepID=UPI002DD8B2EA|nr:trehalase family glycosidase [Micromonospora sp. NBC_01813]WSA12139.1 trehalase family glycosidase [Micromonospora sp. NBC_01813]